MAGALALPVVPAPARAQCVQCADASFGSAAREFAGSSPPTGQAIVADFNGDGVPDVAVLGANPTFYFFDHVLVFPGDGRGGFGPPASYPISPLTNPQTMVAADFDSNGTVDLAIGGDGNHVALFRGVGDGTLMPPQIVTLSTPAYYLGSGDFDGDGRMDLVTVGQNITIYSGNGLGGFSTSVTLPSIGSNHAPVVGDLNGDGISDLVIASSTSQVEVVLGTAVGPFAPPRVYPAGNGPLGLALAPLTSPSRLDLVVRTQDGVEVLLNTGAGTFLPPVHYATPGFNYAGLVFIGEFNGDGKADVLVGNSEGLLFFIGDGAGGLVGPQAVATTTEVSAVADFDHDGLSDLAGGALFVRLNRGGPSTMFPPSWNLENAVNAIAIGDFNEDGRPDLVAVSNDAVVINSTPGGGFAAPVSLRTGYSVGVVVADFNRDGHLDIALTNAYETIMNLGDGTGGFTQLLNLPSTPSPTGIAAGNFNGDLKPDLLITDAGGTLYLFPGKGDGTFQSPTLFAVGANPRSLVVDDFNGDGKPDTAVTTDAGVWILLGNGVGGFQSIQLIPTSRPVGPIISGDFDKDGKKDLALLVQTGYATSFVQVLWGDGTGGMTPATPFSAGPFPGGLASGDFNRDGLPDLVVAGGSPGMGTAFFMNAGSRGWRRSTSFEISGSDGGALPGTVAVGDFDKDGLPDVAASFQRRLFLLYNTNCEVRHLVELTEESGCNVAGVALGVQPRVGVYDDGGNVVVCDSSTVTASLLSGPSGAVLGGTRLVAASSGVAAFTDLSVSVAGTGYQLGFSHPSAGNARSLRFTAGLTVSIGGPSQACVGTAAVFTAGSGYDTYVWEVDGVVKAGAGSTLSVTGLSAGPHTVAVTVSKDRCAVSASKGVDVQAGPSAVVSAPASVCPFSSGNTASVPDAGAGASYSWTVTNGVVTAGQGTPTITFRTGPYGQAVLTVTVTQGCPTTGMRSVTIDPTLSCPGPQGFFTVSPCRLIDTRAADAPALSAGTDRAFAILGRCGIPPTATALSVNITVTQPTAAGFFILRPGSTPQPLASLLNYRPGQTRANNTILSVGAAGDITATCGQPSGSAHLILDVNGYFQ